jgi:hypothetical protein
MCSAGSSVAINNARPSQAEIYAKAGVNLKDGKLPAPSDAAAKDKVVSRSSLLIVPRFCPVLRRGPPSLSAAYSPLRCDWHPLPLPTLRPRLETPFRWPRSC